MKEQYGWTVEDDDGDILSVQNTREGGLALVAKCPSKDIAQGVVLAPETARRFVGALLAILDGDPPAANPDPAFQVPPSFPFDTWTGKGMAYAHIVVSGTAKNGVVISVSNNRDAPAVRLDFAHAHKLVTVALALLGGEDPAKARAISDFLE